MWKEISRAFGEVASAYDAWYEGNPLFLSELKALNALGPVPKPALEIGVGTGVFAEALGFTHGIDPSLEMLSLARQRGVHVVCGVGERLPFKTGSFEAVGLFFTFCFLTDPEAVLREASRSLKPAGKLFLGFVPAESPWGHYYQEKKKNGHRLYRFMRLRKGKEVLRLLEKEGFRIVRGYSTLFQPPAFEPYFEEEPKRGFSPKAGFWALLAEKG